MSRIATRSKAGESTDLVLREIWRIKDTLSAAYGHDVKRLFAEVRKREKLSGHPLVNLQKQRTKRPKS
jgi:hypothetical protein